MNEIYKLIEKLCPEVVSYKCFGDVCDYIRGITYNKAQEAKEYDKNTWKVLRANNITLATKTLNFDDIKEVVSTVKVKDSQHLQKGDILICAGSGSKEHIGKVAYIPENLEYIFGGFMAVIRCHKELNSRFLFHILTGSLFSKYLETALNTTTINNLNATIISGFRIPLPPLAVQQEIVRILDSFTELTTELNKKLTAELTARRKQYEHYRDELLTFAPEVEWKTIGEVCKLSAGGDVPKERFSKNKTEEYTVPILSNGIGENALYGFTDIAKIKAPCVTVAARGTIGYCELRNEDFYPVVRLICACPKEELLPAYLKYYLETIKFQVPTSGIPQLTVPMLSKYKIPIPTLAEQGRIVAILDKFSAICNDLTSGLPAEIAARQKQYEYYRDKLLTFGEKEN